MRRDEFPVDEVLIALLELDVVIGFRRGRVAPALAEIQLPLVRRERSAFAMQEFSWRESQRATTG